jgi:hypothetical protein
MLLNNQESSPAVFLNASDSEDAIVDEVSLVGFYLFFCCLGCLAQWHKVMYFMC